MRALSPGINDPKTAIYCIDVLGKTLGFLNNRILMPNVVIKNGKICIIRPIYNYNALIKASFRAIFDNAKSNRLVLSYLVHMIACLIKIASDVEFKEALILEANIIRLYHELKIFDTTELEKNFSKFKIPIMEENKVMMLVVNE